MKMALRQSKFEVLLPTGQTKLFLMDDLKSPDESLVINIGQAP